MADSAREQETDRADRAADRADPRVDRADPRADIMTADPRNRHPVLPLSP